MAVFEIFKGSDFQYYFRLRASNGEIVLGSEGYVTKEGCKNGIASVKQNAPFDSQYSRRKATDGRHYFNLLAQNYQVIGTSQMYWTEFARENGISVVKREAPFAPVKDLTYSY